MRQRLLPLLALLLLATSHPVQAEPACGSDTSTDPDVARGKDVWLNGYCQGFLPCRLVLEQFHACQAAEGFLSRLDAKEGVPLTESQVEDALLRTTGSATGMSACLWSFDAEGCKRYLGLGGGGQDADSPVAAAGAAAVDAPAARKPMSNTAAVVARQRIRDMDANAHTGVGVIERACKAGAEECRATLEQLVDPVVREAEELNANPEYLAQLPVYAPGSLEYAGRLGWTKQDGRWVFGGGGPATNTGTLGSYLLTVEECRKLHERLTQAIRSDPVKEPTELSFFEAECLPQLPALTADVGQWRQGFGAAGPAAAELVSAEAGAGVSETGSAGAGSEALDQWNVAVLGEDNPEAEYDPADSIGKTEFAGGCYMYEYFSSPDDDLISLTWSGRCEPGKPVNGRGKVEWVSSNLDSRRDSRKAHDRYSQEGTMANGRWRGSVKWAAYIPWNPPDSQHQGGTGQFDELGCARDESDPEDSSGYYAGCRESYSAFDAKQGR